jgi:hypothetical protein
MGTPTSGFLAIADISGYTAFLHGSELEHAQDILTNLLKVLLEETREPMVISRTAGDAVISYALGEPFLQPQTFVDRLEATYAAFRDAIDLMVLNNQCTCSACANVATLDLKFFVHHGTFGVQQLGDHDELVGSDVNLIHRLLKNDVVEKTGVSAYALYTQAALDRLELSEWADTLTPHTESYEHLGDVQVRIQDLAPIADAARAARSQRIPPEETRLESVLDVAAPAALVWDSLNDPDRRKTLIGSSSMARDHRNGRMGVDAKFICYHGNILTEQEVVVYEPLRRLITRERVHLPVGSYVVPVEYELEESDGGTRLVERFGPAKAPWHVWPLERLMFNAVVKRGRTSLLASFKAEIEAARQSR